MLVRLYRGPTGKTRSKIPASNEVRTKNQKIDEIISEMQRRNKLIKLAYRWTGGWEILQESRPDKLGSISKFCL